MAYKIAGNLKESLLGFVKETANEYEVVLNNKALPNRLAHLLNREGAKKES
ncbi:MAG: hypothetical protein LBB06_01320 [Endomicrobium sp.]|nr:hypothetical protein [Endomicrobium sp.]